MQTEQLLCWSGMTDTENVTPDSIENFLLWSSNPAKSYSKKLNNFVLRQSLSLLKAVFKTGMWKRLNFCGNRSTLKKQAGSGSKHESMQLFEEPEAEAFFIKHSQRCGRGSWKWKRLNFYGSGSKLGSNYFIRS